MASASASGSTRALAILSSSVVTGCHSCFWALSAETNIKAARNAATAQMDFFITELDFGRKDRGQRVSDLSRRAQIGFEFLSSVAWSGRAATGPGIFMFLLSRVRLGTRGRRADKPGE